MKIVNTHFVKHKHYKGKMEYLRQNHLVLLCFKVLPEIFCLHTVSQVFTGKKNE